MSTVKSTQTFVIVIEDHEVKSQGCTYNMIKRTITHNGFLEYQDLLEPRMMSSDTTPIKTLNDWLLGKTHDPYRSEWFKALLKSHARIPFQLIFTNPRKFFKHLAEHRKVDVLIADMLDRAKRK